MLLRVTGVLYMFMRCLCDRSGLTKPRRKRPWKKVQTERMVSFSASFSAKNNNVQLVVQVDTGTVQLVVLGIQ